LLLLHITLRLWVATLLTAITRLNYLRDPEFSGMFDPNPRYLLEARRAIAGH